MIFAFNLRAPNIFYNWEVDNECLNIILSSKLRVFAVCTSVWWFSNIIKLSQYEKNIGLNPLPLTCYKQ